MQRVRGFSMIEMMIVVAIVAILAAVAVASYSRYGYRARRADGQNILNHIAVAQERYYSTYNHYTFDLTDLGYDSASDVDSVKGYYKVKLESDGSGDQSFKATASPQGSQAGDKCEELTLNNVGEKHYGGDETNGACWGSPQS